MPDDMIPEPLLPYANLLDFAAAVEAGGGAFEDNAKALAQMIPGLVDQLIEHRGKHQRYDDLHQQASANATAMEVRARQYRAALVRYGRHLPGCGGARKCTCGLADVFRCRP